jgi:small-conductance mechanosensitive channel
MQDVITFELVRIGGAAITLGDLVVAAVVLVGSIFVARLLSRLVERLRGRARVGGGSLYIVQKLVGYGVILAGAFAALNTLGINLTSFAVFAGAIGVGVGLGLQGVVREFVSGLVVIFDGHTNVGDFVELESGTRGVIAEVGPRATRIRTNDSVDVIIPNSKLIENSVINWTLRGDTRRIHVPFAAAYGCDKDQVRRAVLDAARAMPTTLPDTELRKTQVWMTGFGDSALNFELVVWPTVDAVRRPAAMQAAYTWAIHDALMEAGVEIPFPQMDVRLREFFGHEGADALRALRLEAGAAAEPERHATRNDAAEDLVERPGAAEHDPQPTPPGDKRLA